MNGMDWKNRGRVDLPIGAQNLIALSARIMGLF